ncbi:MAG: CPBP family intramembrane metalloprotease [Elusimicrobia bacterium]|nr:CPBP family intramembrane metalloprotease [Elusimicrobiota bacterium]
MREKIIFIFSLAAAAALWFLTFVIKPFNFWAMMSFNAAILIFLTFLSKEKIIFKDDFNLKNAFIGFFSALILYGIFFIGRKAVLFIPGNENMLSSVYEAGPETPRYAVALLLFFPIGFAEEFFWRGFIQKKLYTAYPKIQAVLIASAFYTAVHIPTANPILIAASAVCGLYWGLLYAFAGSFFAVSLSHMIWDPIIFVFFQIR